MMVSRQQQLPFLLALLVASAHSFGVVPNCASSATTRSRLAADKSSSNEPTSPPPPAGGSSALSKQESVASLVDEDEWDGVTMELTTAVTKTIVDSIQRNTKSFVGKDEYKVGDITREIDARMKKAVANLRGKEGYEIGDLVAYITQKGIAVAEQTTGTKLDKYTEMSDNIDKQVKTTVASYVGEENYKSGALAAAVATKVKTRLLDFADRYDLDQIADDLVAKRKVWAKKYLGDEFVDHFTWTDLAKKVTGKDEYHVGDVSKKVLEEAKKMIGIGQKHNPAGPGTATPVKNDAAPTTDETSTSS